jgi:hypothetical protein
MRAFDPSSTGAINCAKLARALQIADARVISMLTKHTPCVLGVEGRDACTNNQG